MREDLTIHKKEHAVAFLWDESYLWGLMAYDTLKSLSLPFDLLSASDIKNGLLKDYRMLFVPGGWASNKLKALGQDGIEAIKEFVFNGGNYFGICGGAGLATLEGIGLLNIKRKPTLSGEVTVERSDKGRVPSFSGRIRLQLKEHPLWKNLSPLKEDQRIFHAWWPSQFEIISEGGETTVEGIKILATFGEALPDAFSSDLNVGDVQRWGRSCWKRFEDLYGINLDPQRLLDEPAVVEGNYGKGKVILSLIHFDTPGDENGGRVLRNIWEYLAGLSPTVTLPPTVGGLTGGNCVSPCVPPTVTSPLGKTEERPELLICHHLLREIEGLINFGIRNFLWFWRNNMLLHWRRGVRGLEYCTLYIMIKRLLEIPDINKDALLRIAEDLRVFKEKSMRLFILERENNSSFANYKNSLDPEITGLREELFGRAKSHGGFFKKLIEQIDRIIFEYLRKEIYCGAPERI